jgi:hypothetical protein
MLILIFIYHSMKSLHGKYQGYRISQHEYTGNIITAQQQKTMQREINSQNNMLVLIENNKTKMKT